MKTRILFSLVAIAFLFVSYANPLEAQSNNFAVTIARPGEGETLYSGPGAPYVCAQIIGWVTADKIDVTQVQVKLELYQGTRAVGSLTAQPAKDGKYLFDVAINDASPDDHPVAECAQGICHIFSSLGFPAGRVLVRVTATDSLGRKAVAERSIVVEHPGSANVPVQVVVDGTSNLVLKGINISAMTRLYEWRSRQYIASIDANGRALFNIESLGQVPTHYVFRLDPIVVNGVQYASREYAQLILPPGATTAEPVKLIVQAIHGQISATVTAQNRPLQNPLTVRAIEVPSGLVHSAKTVEGQVILDNLAVRKQMIRIDGEEAARQGLSSPVRTIDLTTKPITSTTLQLVAAPTRVVRGTVHDSQGNSLPLVWLSPEEQGKSIRTSPATGEFVWASVPSEARSVWVVAPGYWRRAAALDFDSLDIELTREPETRDIRWGNGNILVPRETLGTIDGNHAALNRGWLWGKGTGSFSISTPDAEIELQTGAFAIESLPDATSWLYVIDGQAQVTTRNSDTKITFTAGQMLAFGNGVSQPFAVPLDYNAVQALHAGEELPVRIETDSAPLARVRDELARLGISLERTMLLAGLILGGYLILWIKRRGARAR